MCYVGDILYQNYRHGLPDLVGPINRDIHGSRPQSVFLYCGSTRWRRRKSSNDRSASRWQRNDTIGSENERRKCRSDQNGNDDSPKKRIGFVDVDTLRHHRPPLLRCASEDTGLTQVISSRATTAVTSFRAAAQENGSQVLVVFLLNLADETR